MCRKIMAVLTVSAMAASIAGCSNKGSSVSSSSDSSATSGTDDDTEGETIMNTATVNTAPKTESLAEPFTEHVSPVETLSAVCGSQITLNKTIPYTEGSNTVKIPLADLIKEGDIINSFTFVIYSADEKDIGEFKGGCGISVNMDCPAATDDGWYQSEDFASPTQGTYGKITWNVPADIQNYISPAGELLFGYWWGNTSSIRIEDVVCNYTRTADIPVDGTVTENSGKSISFIAEDNIIRIPTAEFLPENAVPEAIIYNISSSGKLGKFTGGFGYNSSTGYYQSSDTAIFTESSSLSLTWFVPEQAKAYISKNGEIILCYWWSEQPSITLDSITVKYSLSNGSNTAIQPITTPDPEIPDEKSDFRSAEEIVSSINAGWNLGNTLDSYNTGRTGLSTETGWGNNKTTREMIQSVKDAGFNSIRIPVTWGEHMTGDTINADWIARVREVVDYAYDLDMFVILNMHHDDYIWFEPSDSEYPADSAKLKAIWSQIASYFADYGDRLLFEGMNEPRTVGSEKEWIGGTPAERAVINRYAKDFVDTVRKTGGNNSYRSLIITSYAASADTSALNDVVVPASDNIILSVHYYAPWKFSDGSVTDFNDSGKTELDEKFAELKQKFSDKGTPVIVGEFGCINSAPESERQEYYKYYLEAAGKQGIKCFVWDNNITSGEQSFGIFNRGALAWNQAILSAIMEGTE